MADNPTNDVATDTDAPDTLDNLAEQVQTSFSQSGASDETVALVRKFVAEYVKSSNVEMPAESGYNTDLVSDIENYLDLGQSDPTLGSAILTQIEDIAAGRQSAGSDPSQKNVQKAADPIEMFSGQFIHDTIDLAIAGAGMDFQFRRIYKNQTVYFGPLGANWDHNYNLHIRQVGNNLVQSSGESRDDLYTQHPLYGQAGFNYWVPPDGRNGIIEESGGSFVWRSPGGVRRFYQQDSSDPLFHRVSRIQDRFGNYLSFTYQEELLQQIEINHPARFVAFDYDTLDRIIRLQDHTGRQWIYEYDDYGDLVRSTSPSTDRYPQGLSTCYEYSSSDYSPPLQHNLLRIIDPAGQLYLENDYGIDSGLLSFNRVVRQRQGNGEYFFEYEMVVDEFEYDYSDSEKPAIQVNQMLRNGQMVHFIYNRFGNLLLSEEYVWQEGLPNLLQWRYRYNRDGALVGSITPEGCVTQFYYGRDDYLGVYNITDDEVATDSNLTSASRMAFGNLLAVVRRSSRYDFSQMDLSLGVWGDFFPDVLAALDPEDIVVKNTYEPDYQQIMTRSDPRFTASADPRYPEAPGYLQHLIQYEYSALPLMTLSRLRYPDTTFPSPLPNGTTGLTNTSEQYLQYDSRGRLERFQDAEGNIAENDYYQGGPTDARDGYLHTTIGDANNLQLATFYDVNDVGINLGIQNPRGINNTFVVNALDQVIEKVSGGPGFKTQLSYNENGLLDRQERDNLDDALQPSPEGNEVKIWKYDEQNNLLQEINSGTAVTESHTVRHWYDGSDCRIETVFPLGNKVRFDYDERSLLKSTTRGATSDLESTTRILYDGNGWKTAQIDGRGNRTQYAYDLFGRVTSITDALGNLQQNEYDKLGNITITRFFEKHANGDYYLLRRSEFAYDERGSRIRQIDSLFTDPIATADIRHAPDAEFASAVNQGLVTALVTEFFFDRNKRLFRKINARGQETTWEYDGVNREIRRQDNIGNYVRTFYDGNSNVTRIDRHELVQDPSTGAILREDVFSTLNEYDPLDRRIATTDSLGNRTTLTYDSRDHLSSVTDPLGNIRRYKYDIFNRKSLDIAEMTQTGLGGGTRLPDIVTRFHYDENDRLMSIEDANGHLTQFAYDDLNRQFQITYADGTVSRLTYDADNNVVNQKNNNGMQIIYQIDPLGRCTRVDLDQTSLNPLFPYPPGADEFEQYVYDGLGRPSQRVNDFCVIESQFDSLGRPYSERMQFTGPYPGPAGTLVLNRKFDELSNCTDLAYPSGRSIHCDYDGLNRAARITNTAIGNGYPGSGNLPAQYEIAGFEYRGLRLNQISYGNQTACDFAYDGAGRLISTQHGSQGNPFLEIQQLFDGAGNRRFQIDSPGAPGQPDGEIYLFDSLYRLTEYTKKPLQAINPGQYEPSSQPLPATAMIGQQAINNAIGSMVQNPQIDTYRYDPLGNRKRVRRPGQAPIPYTSNDLNQYRVVGGVQLQYDLNGNLIDDGKFLYAYNYRNQLVQSLEKTTNKEVLRLLYDSIGRMIAIREAGQMTFLINDGMNVIEEYVNGSVVSQYVFENGIDQRCQMAVGGEELWYHSDLLSSTRELSDSSGQPLAARYEYEPFGALVSGPAQYNPYLFSGKRLFDSVNIYDSRARQYSPVLGRFLQRDPKGVIEDLNFYGYAGNNPVTFVDSMGREKTSRTQPSSGQTQSEDPDAGTEFQISPDKPDSDSLFMGFAPYPQVPGPYSGQTTILIPKNATEKKLLEFSIQFEFGLDRINALLGKPSEAEQEETKLRNAIAARNGPQLRSARPILATDDVFLKDMERTGSLQSIVEFGLMPVMEFKAVEFAGYVWRGRSVIYGRLNPASGEMYVGQAESWGRFIERQAEHDLALGVRHEYSVLQRPWPGARGIAVDVAEETWIRRAGGPLNQGGWLRNARYQMREESYRLFGGMEPKPTPPLP